ncbi:hypothetical protein [Streptomyces sp. STR69]|uniref:hypothetical protein n=1 Tax=Streptomyces sp. STR69 TaxID=1796942 RepID=UPI0021C8133D|nr:hypothetical protein [Streptomyces sp. STR69]
MDSVRDAFVALSAGEFEMPIRTALRDGQFLGMSAHHRPSGTAMFKTLSLNFAGRQPAIAGTGLGRAACRADRGAAASWHRLLGTDARRDVRGVGDPGA